MLPMALADAPALADVDDKRIRADHQTLEKQLRCAWGK